MKSIAFNLLVGVLLGAASACTSLRSKNASASICAPATCEVLQESQLNQQHQLGFRQGETYGFAQGYKAGKVAGQKKGFAQGLYKGKLDGQVMAYQYLHQFANPPKFMKGSIEHQNFAQIMERVIQGQFQEKGQLEAIQSPRFQYLLRQRYQQGLNDCFEQTYRANLKLGQHIRPRYNLTDKPYINYEYVVEALQALRGNYAYADPATFSKVLYHVHQEILAYIARLLEENEDLIDDKIGHRLQRAEVFQEYQRLHEALATQYYRQYRQRCQALNVHYQKSFYDHSLYFSVEVFVAIVNAGLCSLVDTILTYVKSNTQYAAVAGFEVLGNICEFITAQVVGKLADKLQKRALVHDFKRNEKYLVRSIAQSLRPIIVSHRTYRKTIPAEGIYCETKKDSSYELKASVALEIKAIASVGIDLSQIHLIVSEADQSITVRIPSTARVLEIVDQSYSLGTGTIENAYVTKVISKQRNYFNRRATSGEERKPAPSIQTKRHTHQAQLPTSKIEQLFRQHQYQLAEVQAQQLPLKEGPGLQKVRNILKKVIEPMLVLPSSCYTVYMEFQGQLRKIHEVSCR